MDASQLSDKKIKYLHQKCLRLIQNGKLSSCEKLLEKDHVIILRLITFSCPGPAFPAVETLREVNWVRENNVRWHARFGRLSDLSKYRCSLAPAKLLNENSCENLDETYKNLDRDVREMGLSAPVVVKEGIHTSIFENNTQTDCMFYLVTYAFQSESTLYSCLNVKELLAQNRREI